METIARTIYTQMLQIDRNLVGCMGVRKPTACANGLTFSVNGLSFKGQVTITLNGKDLYDVVLTTPRSKKVVSTHNDIFVEDLMPLLESLVENRSALEPQQGEFDFDLRHEMSEDGCLSY